MLLISLKCNLKDNKGTKVVWSTADLHWNLLVFHITRKNLQTWTNNFSTQGIKTFFVSDFCVE